VDSGGPKEPWRLGSRSPMRSGNFDGGNAVGPGHARTCSVVDILKVTQQGAAPVRCGGRLGCTRWGAYWRHLANMTEPSVCGDNAALLWPPYVIGQAIIFLPCGFFFLLLSFFPSPNLSGRRLDVCHTSTHGVVLVRISDAGLKRGARGSLEMKHAKKSPKIAIWASSHNVVGAISSQLRHVSTIGKKTC